VYDSEPVSLFRSLARLFRRVYCNPVRAAYDRPEWYRELTELYLRGDPWTLLRLREIERLVAPEPRERIVDLGCASGALSHFLAGFGAQVVGVDLSPLALEHAARLCTGRDCRFLAADVASIPELATASMDKAVAGDLVEHLDDRTFESMLTEAHRILRPGGTLSIYTPNRDHLIERMKARGFLLPQNVSHIAVRNPARIRTMVEQAGFEVELAYTTTSHFRGFRHLEAVFKKLPLLAPWFRYRICVRARKPTPTAEDPPDRPHTTLPPFPGRSGLARVADLQQPKLRRLLAVCEDEHRALPGSSPLGWSRRWEYPYALANLPEEGSGRKVLDAGSGVSLLPLLLAQRGFRVHACDLEPSVGRKLARIARRRDLSIETSTQDLARLTLPAASFDRVVCISVLEHTVGPETILEELERVLEPGGELIATFDISVDGERRMPPRRARSLIIHAMKLFDLVHPFTDEKLLTPGALASRPDVLRTSWVRSRNPEQLPWRWISRATLAGLRRGNLGRPFFDLAVMGLVLRKRFRVPTDQ